MLGYLWSEVPKLLFVESERVAQAASKCVGALGAAIFHNQGASIPQRGKPENKQRGGRKTGTGAVPPHRSGGQAASIQLHATVLLEWATGVLKGESGPHTRHAISDDQRTWVLQALQRFMQCCPAELQPTAALQVMKTIQALLDAPSTAARDLSAYLEVLSEAIRFMRAVDIGTLLPDMIDVFLGWAVDPTSTQPCRCGYNFRHAWCNGARRLVMYVSSLCCRALMHKVIQSSGAGWHFAPQPVCNIIASVSADMQAIIASIPGAGATAITTELRPEMRFFVLSGILTAVATVLHHNPSPTVALSVELMAHQLSMVISFSDIVMSQAARPQPGCPPAPVLIQACMQHATVWLALMQRVAPAHGIAKALERPCPTCSLHRCVPAAVPTSWHKAVVQASAATVRDPTSRTVHEGIDDAVVFMVDCAFKNVLRKVGEDHDHPAVGESDASGKAVAHSLPLWLALFLLPSLMVGIDFVSGQASMSTASFSERDSFSAAVAACSKVAAPSSWTLLSVAIPMLEPIGPFCTPVQEMKNAAGAVSSEAKAPGDSDKVKSLSWAAQLWRLHLTLCYVILRRACPEMPEASRGIAALLLSLVTHRAGAAATRHVSNYVQESVQRLMHEQASHGDGVAAVGQSNQDLRGQRAEPLRGRFHFLFGVHLLQTALRRQALPLPALLHLDQELCSLNVVLCMPSAHGSMLPVIDFPASEQVPTSTAARVPRKGIHHGLHGAVGRVEQQLDTDGVPWQDKLQLLQLSVSAAQMAMQTQLASHGSVHSSAATTFRVAAALLLQLCLQTDLLHQDDRSKEDVNPEDTEPESADPLEHVSSLCSMMVQLLPHVLRRCPSAVNTTAASVDLMIVKSFSCSLYQSTGAQPISSRDASAPTNDSVQSCDHAPGRPGKIGQVLLGAAASLMRALMGCSSTPDAARAQLVLLSLTGVGVGGRNHEQFLPVIHSAPGSACRLQKPSNTATADARGMAAAAAAVQAGADALLTDIQKRHKPAAFSPSLASSFLISLMQLANGDGASAKVLLAPGATRHFQRHCRRLVPGLLGATVDVYHTVRFPCDSNVSKGSQPQARCILALMLLSVVVFECLPLCRW